MSASLRLKRYDAPDDKTFRSVTAVSGSASSDYVVVVLKEHSSNKKKLSNEV